MGVKLEIFRRELWPPEKGPRGHSPVGPRRPGQAERLQGRHSQSGRGPRENPLPAADNGPGS
ncbi:hypothetical protein G5576_016926 [Homo sapiens]|uniref:Uncharacterized protein n=1 Tax=Homo sapiens TaxID=9606 RepID=M0R2T5_HUMAN|nr:hypothetical protein KI723_190317 [Homo sapiens]KAI4040005.1 hypothetical protein G5576_016926 [Homo sapiens]